jgi:hypothetical protein
VVVRDSQKFATSSRRAKPHRSIYSYSLPILLLGVSCSTIILHTVILRYQIDSAIRDLENGGHLVQYTLPASDEGEWMKIVSHLTSRRSDRVYSISRVDPYLLDRETIDHPINFNHINMFRNLIHLEISPSLDDSAIQQIRPTSKLRTLRVDGNHEFTSAGVNAIVRQFPNLESLELTCNCTDKDFDSLSDLRNLRNLTLEAHIDGTVFQSFSQLAKLEELVLQESPDLDHGLSKMPNLSSLKRLHLIRLSGNGHTLFSGQEFPKLEHLEVWESDIDDNTIKRLSAIKSLQRLVIMYSSISDDSIGSLRELPRLESLEVANIPWENLAAWIEGLTHLRRLTINRTDLINEGVITNEGKRFLSGWLPRK